MAGAALAWLLQPEWQRFATATHSAHTAVIVSFLGGIHRGIGFRDGMPRLFLWGVVRSLVAAAALLLPPRHRFILELMLLLCCAVDRRVYPAQGLQAGLSLICRLSLVAATSCFVAAAGG